MDPVEVAAPLAAPLDVAGVLEIAEDAVGITLGDPHSACDLPNAHVGALSNSEQYLGVVRNERPLVRRCPG